MATCLMLRGYGVFVKLRRGRVGVRLMRSPRKSLQFSSPRRKQSRSPQSLLSRGRLRFRSTSIADSSDQESPLKCQAVTDASGERLSVRLPVATSCNPDAPQEPLPAQAVDTAALVAVPVPTSAVALDSPSSETPVAVDRALPAATDEELADGFRAAVLRMIDHDTVEQKITCFHAVRPPPINMPDYLDRIRTFFGCSGACYIIGLLYLQRLLEKHPDIKLSPMNCHRLVSTSLTVAVKFHDDTYQDNMIYAKIAGVKIAEFNGLESRFVQLMDWKFAVTPEEYFQCQRLVCEAKPTQA